MTVKTQLDLARAVLREIRVRRYDEEPSAEEKAIVDDAYGAKYLEWKNQRVAYWAVAAIPEIVFRPLVRLVAAEIAPTFNKPYDPENAWSRLCAAVRRPWSGKTVRHEYF